MVYTISTINSTPKLICLNNGLKFIDMHCHTNYSDGLNTPETMLKTAKKLGIKIAITDHNTIKGISKLSNKDTIPGIEVTTKELAEILVYFYSKSNMFSFYNDWLGKTLSIEDFYDSFEDKYGCLVSLSHPCVRKFAHGPAIKPSQKDLGPFKKIKTFEGFNGSWFIKSSLSAFEIAKANDKNITAGSDAHNRYALGAVLVGYENDLFGEIRKKRNLIIGTTKKMEKIAFNFTYKKGRIIK